MSTAPPARIGVTIPESTPSFPRTLLARAGSPNVVVIVLDDLGFAQLGAFGSSIATPAIDRLASEGARYRRFHVTSLFDGGWERWREDVFVRQVATGVVPADTTLSPRPSWVDAWGELSPERRAVSARFMEGPSPASCRTPTRTSVA